MFNPFWLGIFYLTKTLKIVIFTSIFPGHNSIVLCIFTLTAKRGLDWQYIRLNTCTWYVSYWALKNFKGSLFCTCRFQFQEFIFIFDSLFLFHFSNLRSNIIRINIPGLSTPSVSRLSLVLLLLLLLLLLYHRRRD